MVRGVERGGRARARLLAAVAVGILLLWTCARSATPLHDQELPVLGRKRPLIFLSGVPGSGQALLRAMLHVHPHVRCNTETYVMMALLNSEQRWRQYRNESSKMEEAGVSKAVLDNAFAAFCLQLISRRGEQVPRPCHSDPYLLMFGTYVLEVFPNAKFLFMVRDGRATVMERELGCDQVSDRECMRKWNQRARIMYNQCKRLGEARCLLVRHEALVLRPATTLRRVLDFLSVPWENDALKNYTNQFHGVPNEDALHQWVAQIPEDMRAVMDNLAPMLSVLGYDPWSNPPEYRLLLPRPEN